jgi:hypothetical protein
MLATLVAESLWDSPNADPITKISERDSVLGRNNTANPPRPTNPQVAEYST